MPANDVDVGRQVMRGVSTVNGRIVNLHLNDDGTISTSFAGGAVDQGAAGTTQWLVTQDSGEYEFTHVVATVTASGDTTIHTPATGKAIRLHWMYAIDDPAATTYPLIKIKLGGTEIYRVWALAKRQVVTGPVDGTLVMNLSATGNVAVTAILEEI